MTDKTAMGAAFNRATEKQRLSMPRGLTTKEKLADDRALIEAMNDDDLAFEEVSLAENIENIRLELRLWNEGHRDHHPDRWNIGAEHAISKLKARLAICKFEIMRRRKFDQEQQAAERKRTQQEHFENMQVLQDRKRANIEAANKVYHEKSQAFVRCAEKMLPRETFKAIWDAVDAGTPE